METIPADVNDVLDYTESESEDTANESESEATRQTEESTLLVDPEDGYTFRVNAAGDNVRASFSGLDYSRLDNVWVLSINGATYKVLFPKTEDLQVIDGVLVNVGTSNVTGTILGDTLSVNTYFQRTFTVLPITGSNAQNSAYRYGAHAYITTYSPSGGTGYNLSTVQDYGDARVQSRGRFGSNWSSIQIVIIGLLALQVLISFIGGLLKRG